MRQYCLLCIRIFDQSKASYLQLPMAVTPDAKRFSQASKHQFPSFSANFHPSVQNWSTLQLIYQLLGLETSIWQSEKERKIVFALMNKRFARCGAEAPWSL